LNIGESTSKAKENLVSIVNSNVNEGWKSINLFDDEILLKLNVGTVKAFAITYLLHNGLVS